MKLITKQSITYYDCICTGSMNSYEENKPLAKLLKRFDENEAGPALQDEALSKFANGLISNFESEGLMNSGALTPKAKEIIKNQKAWRPLRGQFKMSIVQDGNSCYIVNCEPYYSDNTMGCQLNKTEFQFVGDYENDKGMHIKDIKLDLHCYLSKAKTVDIDCIYDYESGQCSYSIENKSGRIEFAENTYTFKIIDESKAEGHLMEALSNYGCFSRKNTKVILDSYDDRNPFIDEVLTQVFSKGSFSTSLNINTKIDDIKLSISDYQTTRSVLLEYLSRKAQNTYCGISEIQTAVSDFYALFDRYATIKQKSQNLFESLMEYTSAKNPIAHLRLQAYKDLMPTGIENLYIAQVKDYSGDDKSMDDLVNDMIDKKKVISVTTITKYAYKNPGISVGLSLFANALKKRNIDFTVVTAEDTKQYQKPYAKKYYNELLDNENLKVIVKNFDDIKDIHDRYFLFETTNGKIWYKMSGEIDALKYNNTDFSNVDEYTKGEIKEMTVYMVEETGIPDKVKTVMGV